VVLAGDVRVHSVDGDFDRLRVQYGARGRRWLRAQRAGARVDAVLRDGVVGHSDDVDVLAVGRDCKIVRVARHGDGRWRLGGEFAGAGIDAVLPERAGGNVEALAVGGDRDPVSAGPGDHSRHKAERARLLVDPV